MTKVATRTLKGPAFEYMLAKVLDREPTLYMGGSRPEIAVRKGLPIDLESSLLIHSLILAYKPQITPWDHPTEGVLWDCDLIKKGVSTGHHKCLGRALGMLALLINLGEEVEVDDVLLKVSGMI